MSDKRSFYGYNCFNNCLGTLLKDHFKWGINLSLHTKWQFFYYKNWFYNDDFRFIGEYPHPYDSNVFQRLNRIFGVQLKMSENKVKDISELLYLLDGNNKFIILVNKYFFDKNENSGNAVSLLTTVLVDHYDKKKRRFRYYIGDNNYLSYRWIDEDRFMLACKYAPHGYEKNGHFFSITTRNFHSKYNIEEKKNKMARLAIKDILCSANEFILGINEGNNLYGASSIKYFAEDILTWPKHPMNFNIPSNKRIYKRLTDCAVYLEFVKKQRESFGNALLEISEAVPEIRNYMSNWAKQIENISKKWTYIKFMLFLAGTRKQIGTLKIISIKLEEVKKCEIDFLHNVKKSLISII